MQNPPAASRHLKCLLAALWLGLFLAVFFSLRLPNNPQFVRWQFWVAVPTLVDLALPTEPARGMPRSGWEYFPERFDLLAVAGVIVAGAWGAGHLLLRLLRPALPERSLDRTVFAFALGFSALSLATLGCGLAGWLSRPLLGGLIVLATAGELACRFFVDRSARRLQPDGAANQNRVHVRRGVNLTAVLLSAAVSPFLLAMLLGSLLPSVDFDVNEYHFEGPKEFFQAGRITFLEHNVYTSFPFLTEMLALLGMVLRDDWYRGALAGKCVLMCFEPLAGLALFAAGRRWFGTAAGVLAALLYLTTPWIYRIATIAYAEGALCFYLFATLFALLHCRNANSPLKKGTVPAGPADMPREQQSSERDSPLFQQAVKAPAANRQFALAGLMAGSAMACKYPGLLSVVIPLGLAAAWMAIAQLGRCAWKSALAFLLGVAVTIGPWLIKNAVETGNPVYPLAWRIFDGRDWSAEQNARWTKAHSPSTFSPASLGDLVVDIAMRNDWVNPLLLALAPLALIPQGTRRLAGWLWLYLLWLVLSCWLFTHRLDRFWVPLIPVAALLAGAGGGWLWSSAGSKIARALFVCLLLAMGLFQLTFITTRLCGFNEYLMEMKEAEWIAAQMDPEIALLNARLPPGSRVLSVGDAQMFEARFPVVYNTVFDRSIFEEWFAAHPGEPAGPAGLRDPDAIRAKLAEEQITHIYVCWREILRYRSPGNYGYSDFVTPERFGELEQLGILEAPWIVPNSSLELDQLDPGVRREVETWGKSLIRQTGDSQGYLTFQIFPVKPPAENAE